MKKLFTLFAVAMMAVGAQAQKITWTEAIAKGNLNDKEFASGDFKLKLTDTDNKMEVDANSQYFGTEQSYENYTFRLKSGGKSTSKNQMALTIPADGTLKIAVRSASSSATDRNLVLTQNDEEIYNQVVKDADAVTATIEEQEKKVFPVVSVAVKSGTVTITYPVNGLNFYAFELVSGDDAAVKTINADVQDGPAYNLGGQKVADQYKGIVIKNGKKMVVK